MILKCTCKNPYQDKKHGKGNRVYNKMGGKKVESPTYRCTVCGNERKA